LYNKNSISSILSTKGSSVKLYFSGCFNALNKKSTCHSPKKKLSCY
jgi:hypothetical protein